MDQIDPVGALFARAKAADVPMYLVCDRAGIARSTPSRWKNDRSGATVAKLSDLDTALSAIIAERLQGEAAWNP